jgi:hypothetical protein
MGQVTYCTTGGCDNCFNAVLLPEQTQKNIDIPDFAQFKKLAQQHATAANTVIDHDDTWGAPINGPAQIIEDEIWVISGTLTIPANSSVAAQNLFIYVTGDVIINGFFVAQGLSIISDGTITVNGTLRNTMPFRRGLPLPAINTNVTVLRSSFPGGNAINITGQLVNISPFFADNSSDIRGSIIAENSTVTIDSNNINTTVRGSVIGNVVRVNSNADTGTQTRIQYNGNYFPVQPDRIELLK